MRLLTSILLASTLLATPVLAQSAEGGADNGGASSPTSDRVYGAATDIGGETEYTNPSWTRQPVSPAMRQQAQVPNGTRSPLARNDEIFLHEVAAAGMTEVEFGQLAQSNAADPAVRDFARQMVNDHSNANARLAGLVNGTEIVLPRQMNQSYSGNYDNLKNQRGAAFDRAYISGQVDDHRKVLAMLQQEATTGQNPELRAFASDTIPVVQHHLDMAQSLQGRMQMSAR